MDPRVIVRFFNKHGEIEDTDEFQARTMSAARAKATKFLNGNVFMDDLTVEKDNFTPRYAIWSVVPNH